MLRRVKELFGGAESADIQEIRPDEIPNLLTSHEKMWEDELRGSTADSRKKILEIRDQLILAVQNLSASERETAFHPKLEKIAKNSLPQFEKAILVALNRQLPEDADAFYQACTESLKGCVKGLAGPGRYLRNVLPEEMKDIRVLVDEFGKEINTLTPRVAEWRKKKEAVRILRETHSQTREMEMALDELSRDIPSLEIEIADFNFALNKCKNEKETCETALAEDQIFQDEKREVVRSEHELLEVEREAHAVFSTLTHVLRKAEKITHRPDTERLAKELNQVISMIGPGEAPVGEEVLQKVTSVLPVISSMIRSEEIQLKNQEERSLFSAPDEIPGTLSGLVRKRAQALEKMRLIKSQMTAHPAIIRLAEIDEDLKSLEAGIMEKEKRYRELEQKRQEILGEIPARYTRMEQQISLALGKSMRISVPISR